MSATSTDGTGLDQRESPPSATSTVWIVILTIIGLVVAIAIVGTLSMLVYHAREGRPLPEFESLAEHPDTSLHGTVAYYDSTSGCIRLVAAAGQPSAELWCLPTERTDVWVEEGKPAGPQLVWLADGRLEVTMFRWTPTSPNDQQGSPVLTPGWQRIIDPRTGEVEEVPTADVPSTPNLTTQPVTSASGQVIDWSTEPSSGRAEVTLTEGGETRTLLSVHGPGEYTYRFGPVFWSPDDQWIAASDDGRILVITPTEPAVTRVLVTGTGGGAGGGTAGPEFAVTAEDLLGSVAGLDGSVS